MAANGSPMSWYNPETSAGTPAYMIKVDSDGHRNDLLKDDAAFLKQFNQAIHSLLIVMKSVELKKSYWLIPAMILSLKGIERIVNTQVGTAEIGGKCE